MYQIEASVVATCSYRVQGNECLRADLLGPRPVAAGILSVFSGVRKFLTAPPGFYLLKKPWIQNSVPSS